MWSTAEVEIIRDMWHHSKESMIGYTMPQEQMLCVACGTRMCAPSKDAPSADLFKVCEVLRLASKTFEINFFCKKILFFINIVLKDAWLN